MRISPDLWSKTDPNYIFLLFVVAVTLFYIDSEQLGTTGMRKEAIWAKALGAFYAMATLGVMFIRHLG